MRIANRWPGGQAFSWVVLVLNLSAAALQGQPAVPQTETQRADKYPITRLAFPRDADRAVCKVDGKNYTLGEMLEHIERYHAPGITNFLSQPTGNLYFDGKHPAQWVRYFADVVALRAEARHRKMTPEQMDAAASKAMTVAVGRLLKSYGPDKVWGDQERNTIGLKFQQDNGLAVEARGLLDLLVPDDATEPQLYEHYNGFTRELQGRVTFAHILIYHRHPVTLQLLDEAARKKAFKRAEDIRSRLKSDGSNFSEIAAQFSDDRATAARGGVFPNVARFDSRLPPIMSRTAWQLGDGEWTGPVESQFGLHFIKRIKYGLRGTLVFTPKQHPIVRRHRRKMLQENLLYGLRKKHRVTLLY